MSLARLFVAFVPFSCLFVLGGFSLVGLCAIPLAIFWILLFLKVPTRILKLFGLRIERQFTATPYMPNPQPPSIIVIEYHH